VILPDPARPLDAARAGGAFDRILAGAVDEEEIAAFLVALAERGETPEEIAAAANALRERMIGIAAPEGAIDVVGTGGDGAHTLNISTAAAFVVAACGVPVAKHGNRAASSQSGASDVLAALGWQGDLPFDRLEACIAETDIVFLHAARHHPAVAQVAGVRRRLGRRTIFNLLGPLANPARVTRQMIGVYSPEWVRPMAEAAATLGSTDALVAHGSGLDEIAVHGATQLAWMHDGAVFDATLDPAKHGLDGHTLDALRGGTPDDNAAVLTALFAGDRQTPQLRAYAAIVVLNAAAALKLAGAAPGWEQAIAQAGQALESGAAKDRLARFIDFR
jgi:anthranilate phosphoribosyltransferase